jgi:hypothetical protein
MTAPLDWGAYILRPTDPHYPWLSHKLAPHESGIYALHSCDGDLMYIGRSNDISDRLFRHQTRTAFSIDPHYYSFRRVPKLLIAAVEVAHIKALQPHENSFDESAATTFTPQIRDAICTAWAKVLPEMKRRVYARYSDEIEQIAARL